MAHHRRMRLYCFAHAGAGTSSFHGWDGILGPDVEVVPLALPGRGERRGEPRITDREALLADLSKRFTDAPPGPFALYGHSLGAMIAHTVTCALHEAGLPGPSLLAVGACPPPATRTPLSGAHHATDAELVRLLGVMGAVPEGARPGGFWYRTALPVLRDDLALADSLRAAARRPLAPGPLPVPLLVVTGEDDPMVGPDAAAGWDRWTAGPVTRRTLPGDHYFAGRQELPRLLADACRAVGHAAAREGTPHCCSVPALAATDKV
ncbi:alpha/beta fold hydrolase [Streptomyces canus]|uniref:thioesterase II family protein n=1 Tax=Streptomyces canus TaxID=58343 RepID=UPI002F907EF2